MALLANIITARYTLNTVANPRSLGGKQESVGIGNFVIPCSFRKWVFGFFLFVSVLFFVSNPVSVMVTAGGKKTKTLR